MPHNEDVLNKIFLDLDNYSKINIWSVFCKKVFTVGKGIVLLWIFLMWNFNYLIDLAVKRKNIESGMNNLHEITPCILSILKFNCWSYIRIFLYLKPYILLSRIISAAS